MGEETEGAVESTSKLQEKLKALTGVDILTDAGAYKDTYTILREIGEVWEDLDPMDQAAALELMAGKNRANTLAAILNNMEDLKGAYNDALGAEGSALKENAAYLDSIQGRIDLFNNAVQTMWMNFMDSEVIKFLVNVGTAIVKVVDSMGLLSTAAGGFVGIKAMINSIKADFESINAGTFNKDIFGFKTMFESGDVAKQTLNEVNKALDEQTEIKQNNIAATEGQIQADMQKIGTQQAENVVEQAGSVQTGVDTQQKILNEKATWGQVAAEKALAVVKGAAKGLAIGLAVSLGTMLLTKFIGAVSDASKRMDELTDSALDSAEKLNDARDSAEDYKTEIEDLRKQLDGNTLSEQDAYDARARLIEIQNELIDKFGLEAKGINLVTGAVKEQTAAIDELMQKEADSWLKDNYEAYKNATKTVDKKHDSSLTFASSIKRWDGTLQSRTLGTDISDEIFNKFRQDITKIVADAGGSVKTGQQLPTNPFDNTTTYWTISLNDKTADEIDAVYDAIQDYVLNLADDYPEINITQLMKDLKLERDQYVDEDYKKSRELYTEGQRNEAYRYYAKEYGAILDAQEEFYQATTDKDRLAQIEKYNTGVAEAFKAAGGIIGEDGVWQINENSERAHVQKFFKDMQSAFADQEFELKLKADDSELKKSIQTTINNSGLSKLDNTQVKDMIDRGLNVEGAADTSGQYTQEQINGLIQLQAEADKAGISLESLISILVNMGLIAGRPVEAAKESVEAVGVTYSALAAAAEECASAYEILNDGIYDNVEISEDQYNSLKALIGSEEEFADCIDATNGYVITNTKLLNKLVEAKKKEVASDTKLAKSQAKLQYYDLYKEMSNLTKGTKVTDDATLSYIDSLYEQMNALEKTIAQYSLLEAKLLGATNAYEQLEEAQAIDTENDYGSKAEELVNVLAEAFNTAELGTQAAQVAIAGLIPEDEIDKAKTLDEQMQQIYDYFTKGEVSKLFTIKFDADGGISSVEMTKKNVEAFTKELIKSGEVFHGTWDEFTLDASITSLEDFAKAIGVTEEVAFAYLTELEKFDIGWLGGDYETLLDQLMSGNLEYAIDKNLKALADLEYKAAHGQIDKDEYDKQYKALHDAYLKNQDAARANVQEWTSATSKIAEAKKTVDDLNTQLAQEKELGVDTTKTEAALKDAISKLYETQSLLNGLEEPTEVVLQIASEKVEDEIDKISEKLSVKGLTIKDVLVENEDGTFTIKAEYAEEFGNLATLMNEQVAINKLLDTGVTSTNEHLSNIAATVTGIYSLLGGESTNSKNDTSGTDTNGTESSQTEETNNSGSRNEHKESSENQVPQSLPLTYKNGATLDAFDYSDTGGSALAPGNAYVDPATMSGGDIEVENATIETEDAPPFDINDTSGAVQPGIGVSGLQFYPTPQNEMSGGGGSAGGFADESTNEQDTETTVVNAENVEVAGPPTAEQYYGGLGLSSTVDIDAAGEPEEAKGIAEDIAQQILDGYKQANVDLLNRPKVDWTDMNAAGWNTPEGSYSTVDTVTFAASDFGLTDKDGNDYAINVTPILPDGTVIDGGHDGLWQYINDELNKGNQIEDLDIFLGSYDTIEGAEDAAQRLHELQEEYYATKNEVESNPIEIPVNPDPLGLNNADLSIDSLKSSLDSLGVKYSDTIGTWFDGKRELEIDVPDLVAELQSKGWTDTAIQSYLSQLSAIDFGEYLVFQSEPWVAPIDSLIGKLNDVPEDEQTDYEVTGDGEKELNNIQTEWDKVPNNKTTHYTIYKTTVEQTKKKGGILDNLFGGLFGGGDEVDGTAHAQGTAHKGGSWGAEKTETALVGELGPELRVRGDKWELLGEHGAEFRDVRKNDIIFNHKQTEQLLTNGYITGRGKAFAEGTIGGSAYAFARESGVIGTGTKTPIMAKDVTVVSEAKTTVTADKGASINTYDDNAGKLNKDYGNKGSKQNGSGSGKKDAEDEFNEIFDWIAVRLEEINEDIGLKSAKLENAIGSSRQNAVIDDLIELHQKLYDNLTAGASKYYAYAETLLAKVPEEYRKAAQDGSIAIEEFVGEADEETLTAIQEYREWVQKGADATQQAEETLAEIQNLAKQAIDNIAQEYENRSSIPSAQIEQLEAYNALLETTQGAESAKIYNAMQTISKDLLVGLQSQRDDMQEQLNKSVESGEIKVGSQAWYDAISDIAAVDTEIINLTVDTENYQDAINGLHWDAFDNLLSRFDAISDEAKNLIDILGTKDMVDENGNWTNEGITSLGLYAQQMEVAEMQSKKYADEIDYLNKNWKVLGYTEEEYLAKLKELKDGQYESIQAYNDAKDSIVDLTKSRVDAIKKGIDKEIEAYEELISKQKEALDAEKDLHDFEKSVADQQKNIADIERKIAALEGDNSASARAQRAKLQAELAKANADLEETYYDRSVSNKQDALDKELEAFQKEKEEEKEGWDKYLEDTEKVVADGLATIQANTDVVYNTLLDMGKEYSLSIADAITSPWKEGEGAIQSYSEKFGLSMSATVDELKKIAEEFKKTMAEVEQSGTKAIDNVKQNADRYQEATYQEPEQPENPTPDEPEQPPQEENIVLPKKGSKATIKKSATHWSEKSNNKQMSDWVPGRTYTVSNTYGTGASAQVLLSKMEKGKTVYMGWVNIKDLEGYAKGTTGVNNSQFALIDELGEELVIRPSKGRMTFMEKGTGVIPADLTENLMEWGALDPSVMLERNKPEIKVSPEIHNTEFNLTMDIAEVVHIDKVDHENIPDLTKAIEKQLDKYMKNLNNQIRRYVR